MSVISSVITSSPELDEWKDLLLSVCEGEEEESETDYTKTSRYDTPGFT